MAKTGHPNFDYTCLGLWRGAAHKFSIVGNHSGTSFGQSDAQAFMEGVDSPYALSFAPFQSPGITVVASRYYDGQNSAPVFVNDYSTSNPPPAPLTATGTAWGAGASSSYLPLEVCVLLESEVGLGKTSKPIYNRKFLRGISAGAIGYVSDEMVFAPGPAGTAAAEAMGNGDWYGSRVYISPSARSANNWTIGTYPVNHQVPRGRKKKTVAGSSSLLSSAEQLIVDIAKANFAIP